MGKTNKTSLSLKHIDYKLTQISMISRVIPIHLLINILYSKDK